MTKEMLEEMREAESILERDRKIARLHKTRNEYDKEDFIDGIIYAFEEADDKDDFAREVIMELKSYGWDTAGKLYEWNKRL